MNTNVPAFRGSIDAGMNHVIVLSKAHGQDDGRPKN
jgi:hypothetical protein